jgi:integrase
VHASPTSGISVPPVERRQTRFATAEQVEAMLRALHSAKDRALWATALYAGLRRGELMGLHREEIDLATGVIRVERGWDQCEGEVAPKSKQGRRKVPIPAILRDRLVEYLMDGPQSGRIFVGARDSYERWRNAAEAAGVEPLTLHECRHGYAALLRGRRERVDDEAAELLDAFLARSLAVMAHPGKLSEEEFSARGRRGR